MMGITDSEPNIVETKWRVGGFGVWLPRLLFVVVDVTVRKGKGSMLRAHSEE